MKTNVEGRKALPSLCLVFVLASSMLLRTFSLGSRDLTLDEAFSFFFVLDHSFYDLVSPLSSVITSDAHPPLYYATVWFWVNTGYKIMEVLSFSREFAFRFPFAVVGTLTTFVMFCIGRKLGGIRLGLILSLLHGLNSFSAQVVHQTRMYPLVEFLSAILLYEWLFLSSDFTVKRGLLYSLLSSLLFLCHYNSIFYLAVLWLTLLSRFRRDPKFPLLALLCGVACSLWWLPALPTQFTREFSTNAIHGSTGVIVPFTFFHFLIGDRSIALGTGTSVFKFGASFAIFCVIFVSWLWLMAANRRKTPRLGYLLIICGGPLVLNWIATFVVGRAFDATHYAIYALPAFLILIALAFFPWDRKHLALNVMALAIILCTNSMMSASFLRNTLLPYEPWKEACSLLRSYDPAKVYVYPSYLLPLMRFYGSDLRSQGLPQESDLSTLDLGTSEPGGKGKASSVFLIVSHDPGEGESKQKLFQKAFNQHGIRYSLYRITAIQFELRRAQQNMTYRSSPRGAFL